VSLRPSQIPAELVPDEIEESSFDPTPSPGGVPPIRRWWGRHLHEMRWQAELARLVVDPVFHGAGVPRGDGAPVVTIPGFLAGDPSLLVMRDWLRRVGYDAHGSGIQANVDCSDRALDRLEARVAALHERTGRRVALIGHSRGGHFAKALASRHPERIAGVISMGAGLDTPFDISLPTKAAVAAVRAMHHRVDERAATSGCLTDTCSCRFARDYAAPFPEEVPLTSVYSRGDGVVWWEACVVPYAQNVEITGSHVGLAFNRKAYRVVGRALDWARTIRRA
jgi:triacylglycerol lipase